MKLQIHKKWKYMAIDEGFGDGAGVFLYTHKPEFFENIKLWKSNGKCIEFQLEVYDLDFDAITELIQITYPLWERDGEDWILVK